jgi:CxxC motif-containing protein
MSAQVKRFTCVSCPVGCELSVTVDGGEILSVEGNQCKRGEAYGKSEAVHPERVLTSLVNVAGSEMPVSVKSAGPLPKELIPAALEQLRAIELSAPVRIGDVVCADVCASGVDIVATRDIA